MEAFHSELQGMVDGAIAVEDEQLGAQNSPDPAVNTAAGAQNSPDVVVNTAVCGKHVQFGINVPI